MNEQTYYYKFPDGSVSVRTVAFDGVVVDPVPPAGAVAITAAVYNTLLAGLELATRQFVEQLQQAEQLQAAGDFAALIAAGIPPATARRLSGYTVTDDDHGVHLVDQAAGGRA